MKSFLVIGLGRFGSYLSKRLMELGCEVMAVDQQELAVQDVMQVVTNTQIGDCTREDVLRALGVGNFDTCFVCVGDNFQSSLEITAMLHDLGARHIICQVASDIQAKFLLRNGADEIIDPDRHIAERLAVRESKSHLFDYLRLSQEIGIYEIEPHEKWIGKSILELDFRNRYKANILATKEGSTVTTLPSPHYVFKRGEHVMLLGMHKDIEKLLKQ